MDHIRHATKTWDYEYVDLEMIKLLSRVCALCEEEGHAIMDCPFVPFHIRVGTVRHVDLQNVVRTLIHQPYEHESRIFIIKNNL